MTVHQQLQGTCVWLAELSQIFGNSQLWHKRSGFLFLSFFPSSFSYWILCFLDSRACHVNWKYLDNYFSFCIFLGLAFHLPYFTTSEKHWEIQVEISNKWLRKGSKLHQGKQQDWGKEDRPWLSNPVIVFCLLTLWKVEVPCFMAFCLCAGEILTLSKKRFVSLIKKIPFSKNAWRCVAMLTVCVWVTAELWEPADGTGTYTESERKGGHWSKCPWFLWKWAWSSLKHEIWVSVMCLRESTWISRRPSGESSLYWARRNWAAALLSFKKPKEDLAASFDYWRTKKKGTADSSRSSLAGNRHKLKCGEF